jgi:hypothetical protein
MDNEFYNFKNVDPLDVLTKIERSFNIKLGNEGLEKATTFKSLCDLIVSKINLEHGDTCTTQHAFYMLRNAIATSTGIDRCSVTPHTRLSHIFPHEGRIEIIGEIERELGFETKLLQPKRWVIILFSLILLVSFIGLFYNWLIASAGILVSFAGLKLAGKFGKEIHLKTVGDLANKISKETYLKSRHNSGTVNKNEIEHKVRELFTNDLNLKPIVLTGKSPF